MLSRLCLSISTCAIAATAFQLPFLQSVKVAPSSPRMQSAVVLNSYDTGLFTPLGALSVLSYTEYTTLSHPAFPNYNVRIKKSDFCDGTVGTYTGYIDIQARHLFFYFFESRSDPDKDDVIFWTNGGPGCSSSLGLFMELGSVNSPDNVTFNPYSWNEYSNIFFIDQPIGTGFSYAEYEETVNTTPDAAKDIAAFVAIFFEHFSKFRGRAFHMAGESYAGRAVPVYASEIYDQNAKLVEAGIAPINLSSIMIGNGCTDWAMMMRSYYEMQCQPISVSPIQDISTCIRMKQAVPRCEKWMQESCVNQFDSINCEAAYHFCGTEIAMPYDASGYSPHDISKVCATPSAEGICYPSVDDINAYLDKPDVRSKIGVDPSVSGNFSQCNMEVNAAFHAADDLFFYPAQFYIAALLERGIRALIYVGANDWICNWVGNERVTLALEWTGQKTFSTERLREWKVEDTVAGLTRSAGPLTFLTLNGAGHMAPYDKPKESLKMVKRWLTGREM